MSECVYVPIVWACMCVAVCECVRKGVCEGVSVCVNVGVGVRDWVDTEQQLDNGGWDLCMSYLSPTPTHTQRTLLHSHVPEITPLSIISTSTLEIT